MIPVKEVIELSYKIGLNKNNSVDDSSFDENQIHPEGIEYKKELKLS